MKKLERKMSKKGHLYIKWKRCLVVILDSMFNLDWTFSWCKIFVKPNNGFECTSDCFENPFADDPTYFVNEINDIIDHPFGDDEADYVIWYNNYVL